MIDFSEILKTTFPPGDFNSTWRATGATFACFAPLATFAGATFAGATFAGAGFFAGVFFGADFGFAGVFLMCFLLFLWT